MGYIGTNNVIHGANSYCDKLTTDVNCGKLASFSPKLGRALMESLTEAGKLKKNCLKGQPFFYCIMIPPSRVV